MLHNNTLAVTQYQLSNTALSQHVSDVFCPDTDYEPAVRAGGGQRYPVPFLPHQNIPQLDRMEYPDLSLMICRRREREKEEEERRKDREKDLKNIEMLIKKNFQF